MQLPLKQIAHFLDLPANTVSRWIRQGRIPIRRTGGTCVFNEAVLEKWARNHNLKFCISEERCDPLTPKPKGHLLDAMQRGDVFHDLPGNGVVEVMEAAVAVLGYLSAEDKDTLLQRLIERERMASTGVGKGVAIPHPRIPLEGAIVEPVITTCFLASPVDFKAVDDKPVSVLFLLLSDQVKTHLHLLSRLSFCVRDDTFVDFLKTAPEKALLFQKVAAFENQLDRAES